VRALLALLAATLLAAPAQAQPVIDYAREDRWAQEVVPAIVVGDAVYLATPGRSKVLAILTEPAGAPKGGVVVVHGLGVHPDFGMTGAVRTGLADAGFLTLAVQMPVLPANASRDDYRVTYPAAGDRIASAIAYLRAKGVAKVAIVAHSVGASMADAYLARPGAAPIDAWAPVGMLVDFTVQPKVPLLDVIAATEFPEVEAVAPLRAQRLPKDACSRQVVIPGTQHYFDRGQKELVAAVAAFLERVFAKAC
jgi:dienelactone hydrolase